MKLEKICTTCRKPKANYECGSCHVEICKSCSHFVGIDTFSFLKKIPKELTHSIYCNQCFDQHVSAPLSDYEETLERAKEVIVFSKDETKKTAHIKRKEEPYFVEDCEDKDEAIQRLAFFAAADGFNCLLDIQISHRKIIVGSHKKTVFSAKGIPVNIDPSEVREY